MERPIVETQQEAKQGRWGAPVLFVLAASIVLVAIAFAIVALVRPW